MKKSTARKPVLAPQVSVGIDLASTSAVACVLDSSGKVAQTRTIELTPAAVRQEFDGVPVVIVMESCNVSGWVARLLEEMGHEVLVCNPRRLKMIAESTLKTDKLDAMVLARLARLHQLEPELVHQSVVRSRQTQLHRSVLACRDQVVTIRTRLVTLVKSILSADACPRPKCDAENFAARVGAMDLPDDVRAVVAPLLVMLEEVERQIKAYDMKVREIAKANEVVRAWCAIDGIGEIVGVSTLLTIEDPHRFAHARDVGPYLGFVPIVRSSGDTERRGRCTKAGDARTRRCLVQAALILMRSRHDSALKQWGLAVAGRQGKKKAIVAVARKLSVIMVRMWQTREPYVRFPGKEEVRPAA